MNIQLLRDEEVTQVVGGDLTGPGNMSPVDVAFIFDPSTGTTALLVTRESLGIVLLIVEQEVGRFSGGVGVTP